MKRRIIEIDQDKCNGCGACIAPCPVSAVQRIAGVGGATPNPELP